MKKTLYTLGSIVLAFMMLSCEDIYEGGNMDREPMTVQMKASILPFDSAFPEKWKGGEEVGMFMYSSSDAEGMSSAACLRLTADAEGVLSPAGQDVMPQYPSDASKVNFVCFYPYSASAAESKTLALDVSSDGKAVLSDYLYSDNARNKYPSLSPVKLQMKHVLSLVRFEISAAEEVPADALKGLNPQIEGVPVQGVFSLSGGCMASSGEPSTIAMKTDGQIAESLLMPVASSVTVRCDIDGLPFRKKLGSLNFESGKLYIFDLHVTRPGFDISLREIEDWKVERFD